jgi:hypothetical protein
MRRETITLDGVAYATKKAARAAVRDMVAVAILARPLTGSFQKVCLDLLDRHPDRDDKAGCGILHFQIVEMPGLLGRHMQLVRQDGSTDLISWNACINGFKHPPSLESVARREIADQIVQFKNRAYWLTDFAPCHCCGALARYRDTVVHHAPPDFRALLSDWLSTLAEPPAIEGNGLDARFADPDTASSWRSFHARWAVLQLISVACHKQIHHPAREAAE